MAVRNCKEIGENLQKIVSRLMANDNLIKLLYYADQDPLSHENLTSAQKSDIIFEKMIKIVPRIGSFETSQSIIAIRVLRGEQISANTEFKEVSIGIEVYVPLTQWIIKDSNLRPFAILGEIQSSLNGIKINGLGKLEGGDFELDLVTDEMSCYVSTYTLTAYD